MAATDYESIHPEFRECFNRSANLERLWSGGRWTEGPVYFPAGRYLLFSDIPNDRVMRYDECDGSVSVFLQPAAYANGHTVDRQGRLVSCEQGERRVTRTEHDGRTTVIADRHQGKRFNSPNDVVVKSDDTIWFTDPPYGILSDYEGNRGQSELGGNFVFRADNASGELRVVADDFIRPNGLAFSLDEKRLYVVDSGPPKHIRVFEVAADGKLAGGQVFADCTAGRFDGIRVDDAGRVWAAADDGVHCMTADGTLIGKIRVPEICANLVFGGPKRNHLFICGTTSLYCVLLPINGAKTF